MCDAADERLDGVTAGRRAPLPGNLGRGCANFVTGPALPPLYPSSSITPSPPPPHVLVQLIQSSPPSELNLRAPPPTPSSPSMRRSPPPSFIWIPQWGLFVQWLPLHCAAKGSRVNGQANEFLLQPTVVLGRTHAHTHARVRSDTLTYMCPLHKRTHRYHSGRLFSNRTSFICESVTFDPDTKASLWMEMPTHYRVCRPRRVYHVDVVFFCFFFIAFMLYGCFVMSYLFKPALFDVHTYIHSVMRLDTWWM